MIFFSGTARSRVCNAAEAREEDKAVPATIAARLDAAEAGGTVDATFAGTADADGDGGGDADETEANSSTSNRIGDDERGRGAEVAVADTCFVSDFDALDAFDDFDTIADFAGFGFGTTLVAMGFVPLSFGRRAIG